MTVGPGLTGVGSVSEFMYRFRGMLLSRGDIGLSGISPSGPAPMPCGLLNVSRPRGPGPQRCQIHRFRCLAVSDPVGRMTNLRLAKPLRRCPRSGQGCQHRQQPRLSSRRTSTAPRRCQSCIWFPTVGGGRFCLYHCRFHALPTRILSRLLYSYFRSRPSSIHHPLVPGDPPSAYI